jgi:tetratricopeptide (TPR) repeat protein
MARNATRCIDRKFYTSRMPDGSSEEARAILLGQYEEKELDPALEKLVREHLDRCDSCAQFLAGLEDVPNAMFIEASCPSSVAIDAFLFNRHQLQEKEAARIEHHVEECEMCREELAWLKDLEARKIVEFSPAARRNWPQILSIAAAVFFAVLASALLLQIAQIRNTEAKLQALAVVKRPNEINFDRLRTSSVSLPEDLDRIYQDGVNSLRQGNFEESARDMEKVVASAPNHSGALYLLGYSYYQMRQTEKAFEICDRAEQMQPHDLERCLSLVQIALKTGHYGRAIREISALHHNAPDQPQVKVLYDQITSITRGKKIEL